MQSDPKICPIGTSIPRRAHDEKSKLSSSYAILQRRLTINIREEKNSERLTSKGYSEIIDPYLILVGVRA